MKVVALVPIKLHSERVKDKNKRLLGKHPLAYYVPDTLSKVKGIDKIYIYCSDEEVKKFVPSSSTFLRREAWLDGNTVKGKDIYTAFINEIDADIYILAHTTSPFLKVETIQTALDKVLSGEYDSAFSAKKIQTFVWYKGQTLNYDLNDVPRTQDIEPIYYETSSFFIFRKEIFTKHGRRIGFKPYIQEVDNIESVDIDEPDDFAFASLLMKEKEKNE
jgi:CMP-N-acetylneuraminic acid synthetase